MERKLILVWSIAFILTLTACGQDVGFNREATEEVAVEQTLPLDVNEQLEQEESEEAFSELEYCDDKANKKLSKRMQKLEKKVKALKKKLKNKAKTLKKLKKKIKKLRKRK